MRTVRKSIGVAAVLGVWSAFGVIDPRAGSAQASEQWRPIGITLDRCFPPMPFEAYERGAGSADAVIQGASFTRPPPDSGLGCPIE